MSTIAITPQQGQTDVVEVLRERYGDARVLVDESTRQLLSLDFSEEPGATALAVVQPASTDEVVELVRLAAERELRLVVRGGGMSYCRGHVSDDAAVLIVDMRRMNRIVDWNPDDLYITVETGITWQELNAFLKDKSYRVPFFGTLSGAYAQVGGGLSQNSAGLGRRFLSDHVRSVEVVLGDGRVLRTGAAAAVGSAPFTRNFGPDLTGLFLSDSGALGIKTTVTLALEPRPRGTSFASYRFDTVTELVEAMTAITRTGLSVECIAADNYMGKAMTNMPPPPKEVMRQMASDVLRAGSSRLRSLRQLAKAARPGGLKFLEGAPFSLAVVVDAPDMRISDRLVRTVDRIARKAGGKRMPTALALGMRFGPLPAVSALMIGMNGETNFPSNAMFPLSAGSAAVAALDRFFADNAELMQAHGIFEARNYLAFDNCFAIEPIIYWRGRMSPFRLSFVEDEDQRRALEAIPDDPETTAVAVDLRHRMIDALRAAGALNIQIGKVYPYRDALGGETAWQLVESIKQVVDPGGRLNPGTLGLR